jgi:predicted site-specific integrase-resolvase
MATKLRFLDPMLVSVPEFARLSGLGYSVTRQLVKDGHLPVTTINNRRWIIREQAIEWIRRQTEVTQEPAVRGTKRNTAA